MVDISTDVDPTPALSNQFLILNRIFTNPLIYALILCPPRVNSPSVPFWYCSILICYQVFFLICVSLEKSSEQKIILLSFVFHWLDIDIVVSVRLISSYQFSSGFVEPFMKVLLFRSIQCNNRLVKLELGCFILGTARFIWNWAVLLEKGSELLQNLLLNLHALLTTMYGTHHCYWICFE
jgi:hypothetical protein